MSAMRFVLRAEYASRFERLSPATCSECGAAVVHEPEAEPVVLVCIECLVKDSPPLERSTGAHPFVHAEHCAECATFNPHPRLYDPPTWSGAW